MYYRRLTAIVLAASITTAPSLAQKDACKIPIRPPQKTATATTSSASPKSTGSRIVDLRHVPESRRAAVISGLKKTDVPLVSRALLADTAVMERLRSARPGVVVLESPDGLRASQQLGKTVAGIQIVSGIPNDAAQIRQVYGNDVAVTPAALRQMKRATQRAERLPKAPTTGTLASTALHEARRSDTSAALVLLAHNDGNHLRFPDGSTLSLTEFRSAADASGRPELVVSCDTAGILQHSLAGIGTTKRIDFANAAEALHAARGERTVGGILDSFAKHYQSPETQLRNRILVVVAIGTVLIIIAILLGDDDDDLVAAS